MAPRSRDWFLDPFGEQVGTEVAIDQLSLIRIACVAAAAGARMQRDGLGLDPLEWMITPVELFGGLPPIEACMERIPCAQAVLLHGLGLDPTSGPDILDLFTAAEAPEAEEVGHD